MHEARQFIVRYLPGPDQRRGTGPAINGRASCTMKSAPLKKLALFCQSSLLADDALRDVSR